MRTQAEIRTRDTPEDDLTPEIVEARDDHEVVCAVAIGYRAPPETLPGELAEQAVQPSHRKPLETIAQQGTLQAT